MKKFFFFIALSVTVTMNSQSTKGVENRLFKINALAPGVSFELGTGANSTFNFEAFVGIQAGYSSISGTSIELFPTLGAEYRYFYNLDRRLAKGKNTSGNSGNYFAALNQLVFRAPILGNLEYDDPLSYNAALLYGFQRTYGKGFYFNVAAGPGFFTGDNDPSLGLFVNGTIGWVISKKN